VLFGKFEEQGEAVLSAEKLGEVWAGRSVEESWQWEVGEYLVCFRTQNSSCKVLHACEHGYMHVCSEKMYTT